jgi:hypothetical protein
MHRFNWEMHYDPIPGAGGGGRGGSGGEVGAVPHRTYRGVNSPWDPPVVYTVRLTAKMMDPRIKVTPPVQQIFIPTARIESEAENALSARKEARASIDKPEAQPQSAAPIAKLEEIAPMKEPALQAGSGRRFLPPPRL